MPPLAHVSRKWTLGLVLLGTVIVLWVLSSFLINMIFEDDLYRKPFFITYINTASFIFYLLPTLRSAVTKWWHSRQWQMHNELRLAEEGDPQDFAQGTGPDGTDAQVLVRRISAASNISAARMRYGSTGSVADLLADGQQQGSLRGRNSFSSIVSIRLSLHDTVRLSAQFCALWFIANFATNASLAYTSVASQTMLSSTSSFFTLFIGALGKVETVTKPKVIGSILSFLGIALVTQSDSLQGHLPIKPGMTGATALSSQPGDFTSWTSMVGNVLAITGALFYGIYSTLLKIKVRDESMINMKIFFGFVGLCTLLFMWPTLIVLHYMGWERFELPRDPRVIAIIASNMMITFVSDFCWAKAMLLTSPLTVTVGLSITIPVAMFGDILFKKKEMPIEYLLGGLLILVSFFIISKNTEQEEAEEVASLYESLGVQEIDE
ncbi:hypothetical protein DAKH74_001290 [Maudiozyma humilis]|uniref:EamA domain-containing protein n=1 Tax=Maudiozyma humilis TaxID=51915 RepID=A0AAV5RQK7_MAUHU|nr:hypothetical protein DAKH74_001290 [Kazachstania humilis]